MNISDNAYHICCPLSNTLIFLQANTYQAVLITNLETSYALFKYDCNSIQWAGRFKSPDLTHLPPPPFSTILQLDRVMLTTLYVKTGICCMKSVLLKV